jgi:drug/metabolite transporter (DMT)-like permease
MASYAIEIVSIILVAALWGCTNPLLRKASTDLTDPAETNETSETISSIRSALSYISKFRHVAVWLPYALNQLGSVLFYYTLANTDLSLAVPACNALSLVFSIFTSWNIGEQIDQPLQTLFGASLIVGGVVVCLRASSQQDDS